MLTEIITIGDEILIGQIVDTNSAWIAQKLNDNGIRVKQITSISDDRNHILEALAAAAKRADLIIITGGLGPTKDDITKKTLCEYFGARLRRDSSVLEHVRKLLSSHNRPILEINEQQADVPENCTVLQNKNGTAPGMWFEHGGKVYVSMPGVPFEMMYLVDEEVLPRLKNYFSLSAIVHHTILTAGIGESFLAETIAPVESALPPYIKLAYLPKLGQVRLRLSAYGEDEGTLQEEVEYYAGQIISLIPEFVIVAGDKPLEKAVLDYMKTLGLKLALAESCTGGYLSHLITQHAGSSEVFLGGAVSYSNDLKTQMLGVSEETLASYGAVSEETVIEMAVGARNNFHADYAVSISGIAGPGGGTPDKPTGTVWIGVAGKNRVITRKFVFPGRRTQNIERAAVNALVLLLKLVREDHA
ncbi:nicotinamide-nucleotide amidase [Arcticibacter tournemirensis]|uniref:CinA-like protein n=1 Tax=Arcticibacter tournemirensis TaxID=699437 RepID=A0A5M9H9P8_9SPHI|nr:competence/damage-inducible protein A [Arcticibacter tournemirensis]KAA8483656.1 competence/damage-inducible protein A [Arcticibacter tournemirensis]TQM51385.1 nicotinamide-nucleotide amidase [Arcticibacter tournemirensis]